MSNISGTHDKRGCAIKPVDLKQYRTVSLQDTVRWDNISIMIDWNEMRKNPSEKQLKWKYKLSSTMEESTPKYVFTGFE